VKEKYFKRAVDWRTWFVDHATRRLGTHNFSANTLTAPSVGQCKHRSVSYNNTTA